MTIRLPRGLQLATGLAALFIVFQLQAQTRPLWAPKAPEKPEAPPMPVSETPEPDFDMERPVFHRPAAEADIEQPVTTPVVGDLPGAESALDGAEAPDETAYAEQDTALAGSAETGGEPVEEPLVEAEESVASQEPVEALPADMALETTDSREPSTEPSVVEPTERLAMNVPSPSTTASPTAQDNAQRLKVLSRGRLPQLPSAFYNGVEGWVRLEFDLDRSGKPVNIHVLEARPRRVFNRVAMKYLRTWRYQTEGLSDTALQQRRKVKVEFKH